MGLRELDIHYPNLSIIAYISPAGFLLFVHSLSLVQSQQMCLFQEKWQEQQAVITFPTASTLLTSSLLDSFVDVSEANTSGNITIKEKSGDMFHLIVTARGRGQIFIQKNGKVALKGNVNKISPSGSTVRYGVTVTSGSPRDNIAPMPLGVMVLKGGEVQEYQENGFLRPGDSIR